MLRLSRLSAIVGLCAVMATTGAWAGKDGQFACWLDGAWSFRAPADGWVAYVVDDAALAVRQAGAWQSLVLLEEYDMRTAAAMASAA